PICPRWNDFYFASIIQISLDPSSFGEIVWTTQYEKYDFWVIGATYGRSLYANGYSDIQGYYERPIGSDGDNGQGVCLSDTRLVICSKAGFLRVFQINIHPPRLVYDKQIGNSVVNGTSNYGSTLTPDGIFCTIITQGYYPSNVNALPPSPVNFPAQLQWYESQYVSYEPLQSFVYAFSIQKLKTLWTSRVLPGNTTPPYACSLAQISSSQHLVYIPAADGKLYVKDILTGETVKVFELDQTAGQSSPVILNNEMYVFLGRSSLSFYFNESGAQYAPGIHLYKYILQ
ncbi:hypothetical protein EBU71_16580, partial [bacterium]|nr:hypothetical protein [Candidatus Elulimicrobium humile]